MRLNELQRARFEPEMETYAEYISSMAGVVKDEMLEAMFSRYCAGQLTEEDVLEFVNGCNLSNMRCFIKI